MLLRPLDGLFYSDIQITRQYRSFALISFKSTIWYWKQGFVNISLVVINTLYAWLYHEDRFEPCL